MAAVAAGLTSPTAMATKTAWPTGASEESGRKRRRHEEEEPRAKAEGGEELRPSATAGGAAAISEAHKEQGEARVLACPYYLSQVKVCCERKQSSRWIMMVGKSQPRGPDLRANTREEVEPCARCNFDVMDAGVGVVSG